MAADPVYDLIENQKPTRAPGRCSVVRDRGALVCDPRFTVTGIVCAEHGPRVTAHGPRGAFEGARVMRTWGLHRDWLERDSDSGERNAPSNKKSGNLSGNFPDPAQNFRFLEKEKHLQHIELNGLFFVS